MPFYQSSNSNDTTGLNSLYFSDISLLDHFHKNPETVYVFDGECEIKISGTSYRMKKNQCAIIMSNQIHSFFVGRSSRIGICVFPESLVPEFSAIVSGKISECPVFDCSKHASKAFETIMKPCEKLILCACLYTICSEFVSNANLYSPGSSHCSDDSDLAHKIISYISDNFTDESISLSAVALHLGYDKNYISRVFHKTFSTGFRETINSHRIDLAKKLLTVENQSITEIAYKCGFSTPRTFNRAFMKLCGTTPQQFKAKNRNT